MRVFISHSSRDSAFAQAASDALKGAGIEDVFLDVDTGNGLVAGPAFDNQLAERLNGAAVIIPLISSNFLASSWCLAEVRAAIILRKEVVPFLVDGLDHSSLPSELAVRQMPSLGDPAQSEIFVRSVRESLDRAKVRIGEDETTAGIKSYVEGLHRFCTKATYTLSDSLPSDAEKLFVDTEGGLTTIEALSAQAQGDTSGKPVTATLARELLAEIVNKQGAVVLCGGAGTGKSTLLRRFAFLAWEAPETIGLNTKRLAVLVRLRHLASARGETFDQKIKQALIAAGDFVLERPMPDNFLTSWPEGANVPLLFLFDGLDEASSDERARLLAFLEQLHAKLPEVPFVLSTRDSNLVRGTAFATAEKTACVALQQLTPRTATRIASALISEGELVRFMQERERGRSFAFDTALGVRMAVALFKRDGKLPETRGELYEQLIRQSFGDRAEGAVQTPPVLVNEEGILHVLGAVASMNLDPSIISAPNISSCIADALEELRRDLSTVLARGAAPEVASWLLRRGGVLTSLDPLAWSHETYREFLAARWIAHRQKPDDPAILGLIKRGHTEPRLRSVLLFAYSIWAASVPYREETARAALAEKVHASFLAPSRPPKKPSLLQSLIGIKPAPAGPSPLATDAPATLFLAEIFSEIRPGPTPAIKSVIDRLSTIHRDFVGYFDEPKNRCKGDENAVVCLRRWADQPALLQALQPLADRYMKLFHQFDLPKSGVVHFLLVAGRKDVVAPMLIGGGLKWDNDIPESIRGAVAAEGQSSTTAVGLARAVFSGVYVSVLTPNALASGADYVPGSKDMFQDERAWITPEGDHKNAEYYSAFSETTLVLHNAGFTNEVMAAITRDDFPIDVYSGCVGQKKVDNGLVMACARNVSLPAPKRAFAISVLRDREAIADLDADDTIAVLAAAEQDPAHTRWAAPLKAGYCEKLERYEDARASYDLLTRKRPNDGALWFELGWSCYKLERYEEALGAFDKAKVLNQRVDFVDYLRGRCLLARRRYPEAVDAFNASALSGCHTLKMWEYRLEAKHFASWYASVLDDTETLWRGNHRHRPFVRHWRAIGLCFAGCYAEALEIFSLLDAEPYRAPEVPYFRAIALIRSGACDQAAELISTTTSIGESWKQVLSAMLSAAKGVPPANDIAMTRDQILSGDAPTEELEPCFWLCAALDDVEGARRCAQTVGSRKDIRVLKVIKADLASFVSPLAKPWCYRLIEEAARDMPYPRPSASGISVYKPSLAARQPKPPQEPIRKGLHYSGVECRLSSIATLDHEQTLARELMASHATADRAIVMIRMGKTAHMFTLCNFKFSEQDDYNLKHSGPLNLYIAYEGRCALREQILDPYSVRQVICNDREFISAMKKGVRTRQPMEYIFVDRLPDFQGREVIYGP